MTRTQEQLQAAADWNKNPIPDGYDYNIQETIQFALRFTAKASGEGDDIPIKSKSFDMQLNELEHLNITQIIELIDWSLEIVCCPPCGIDKMSTRQLWQHQSQKHDKAKKVSNKLKAMIAEIAKETATTKGNDDE